MTALLDLAVNGGFVTWLGCLVALFPTRQLASLVRR